MGGFAIHLAVAEDLAEILSVLAECVQGMRERGIEQWDEIYPNREVLQEDIESRTLYVARAEGALAGLVVLNGRQDPEYLDLAWRHNPEKIGVVHRLMVRPGYQGRGLARRLMEFVEAEAGRQGLGAIRLDSFTLNPHALGLYEKLGYAEVGHIQLRKGRFLCFEKEIGIAQNKGMR